MLGEYKLLMAELYKNIIKQSKIRFSVGTNNIINLGEYIVTKWASRG